MPCQDECILIEASDVPVLLFTDAPTLLQAVDAPLLLLDPNPRTTLLQFLDPAPTILLDPGSGPSGGGGGTGLAGEVWKVLFTNDGEVLLRFDGTIVTGRI